MTNPTPYRISGIAGLLFVAISFVASGINIQPPAYVQDQATLAAWFAAHGSKFRFGYFIASVAFLPFYFPFFAGFCEKLREAEGTPAIWSRVAWAGAIMSPAAGITAGAFNVGMALLEDRVSLELAAFGSAANFFAFPVVSGAMNSIFMMGAAVVILRSRVFARWLGWTAVVIGIAAAAGSAALVGGNPVGLFATISTYSWPAYFLWIAAASVALIREPSATIKS